MNHTSNSFALQWTAPDNTDKFDLDYYVIQVTQLSRILLQAGEDMTFNKYSLNLISTELAYPFGLDDLILQNLDVVNLSVFAVSKCSEQSLPLIFPDLEPRSTGIQPESTQPGTSASLSNGKAIK